MLLGLGTGERRVFDADVDGLVEQAALSPDGRSMATLADEDGVRVGVTDLATGARKPLWSAEGWRSDAGVAWSPDGSLLAVGFIDEEEDRTDTVVLSVADGSVLARYEGLGAPGSPNGVWTGERELLLIEEFSDETVPPLFLHDVATGAVRRFDRAPGQVGGVSAVAAGRLVQRLPGGLFGCALDGSDPAPCSDSPDVRGRVLRRERGVPAAVEPGSGTDGFRPCPISCFLLSRSVPNSLEFFPGSGRTALLGKCRFELDRAYRVHPELREMFRLRSGPE